MSHPVLRLCYDHAEVTVTDRRLFSEPRLADHCTPVQKIWFYNSDGSLWKLVKGEPEGLRNETAGLHHPHPLCAQQEWIYPSCTNDNGSTLYSLWGFLPCNSLPGQEQPVQRLQREIPMGATWLSITAFHFLLCGETLAGI
ncbi:unnamed protein product [Pleuronectes platessa]|uniref:Uncharacterized protein n=1 Tax=Pleuronectes platessa TaxID=8262 RepID=A0A9N7VLK8_PLEPL|nr:unnamed protein product [Pleuronectes platessa]